MLELESWEVIGEDISIVVKTRLHIKSPVRNVVDSTEQEPPFSDVTVLDFAVATIESMCADDEEVSYIVDD